MGESVGTEGVPVVARAAWGADESRRFVDGRERWPPTYATAEALVVHHTRTTNDDPSPDATVRAIYAFHADVRGWGDIGYHWVVAPDGRVFAGRWDGGRPHVVAGHALGHNTGTEGIAVLGNFEHEPPTAAAWQSLVAVLAWRCRSLGLDPLGRSGPLGPPGARRTFPTILGHGDCRPTTCPGEQLATVLPELRDEVAAALAPSGQVRVNRQTSRKGSPSNAARTASGKTA
jgi:N-acetylmuramoyl-L-alanine amidase